MFRNQFPQNVALLGLDPNGAWKSFRTIDAGILKITTGGLAELIIHPLSSKGVGFLNLRSVTLRRQP